MAEAKPFRIEVESQPNPRCLSFYTTIRISNHPICRFDRSEQDLFSHDHAVRKLGPIGAELVRKTLELPGIDSIFISSYEFSPHVEAGFDWERILNDILSFLKQCFGNRADEVEITLCWELPDGGNTTAHTTD